MPPPAPADVATLDANDRAAKPPSAVPIKVNTSLKPNTASSACNGHAKPPDSNYPIHRRNGSEDSKIRLPFDAPEYVLRDVIYVSNPEHIAAETRDLRKVKLEELFTRYMAQIQYGCKNPACKTPTCLSFRRRQNKVPLRKYTTLSARALAYSMITERDPEAGLCHNEPNGPENTPEFRQPTHLSKRRRDVFRSNEESMEKQVNGEIRLPKTRSRHRSVQPGPTPGSIQARTTSSPVDPLSCASESAVSGRRAKAILENPESQKKDLKSFTQSLFDTRAMRLLNWTPFLRDNYEKESSADASHTNVSTPNGHIGLEDQKISRRASRSSGSLDTGRPADWRGSSGIIARPNILTGDSTPENEIGEQLPEREIGNMGEEDKSFSEASTFPLGDGSPRPTGIHSLSRLQDSIKTLSKDVSDDFKKSRQRPPSLSDDETSDTVPTLSALSVQSLCWMSRTDPARLPLITPKSIHANTEHDRSSRDLQQFIDQSLHFCLSFPRPLVDSVLNWHDLGGQRGVSLQDFRLVDHGTFLFLRGCVHTRPLSTVLQCILASVRHAYTPPVWLQAARQRRLSYQRDFVEVELSGSGSQAAHSSAPSHIDDSHAALICAFCLFALTYPFLPDNLGKHDVMGDATECINEVDWFDQSAFEHMSWGQISKMFSGNDVNNPYHKDLLPGHYGPTDFFEDMNALRIFETVMEIVNTRLAFQQMSRTRKVQEGASSVTKRKKLDFSQLIMRHLESSKVFSGAEAPNHILHYILLWCHKLIARTWNGKPILRRATPIAGCISFLSTIYQNRQVCNLTPDLFYMKRWPKKLDTMEMPVEWLNFQPNNKEIHILSYSFLFKPSVLVSYFRAVNFYIMSKSFESASITSREVNEWVMRSGITLYGTGPMLAAIRPQMAEFLVLTVRRDNVLTDAINQIWRRQRREIMRPLKVLLGSNEGEEGVDLGGVQQEFFVVLMAEALNPDFGMFTIDENNRMTWFQPVSPEPLYKFEVLGILFSIAVYNSITLPITFPLAFYRKLLGLKVKNIQHIADGWPELAKGLQRMLEWDDGDVADVFTRTYEFSYDAFGTHISVDMKKIGRDGQWPPADRKKGKEKAKTATFDFPPSPQFTPPDDISPPLSPFKHLNLVNSPLTDIRGTSTPLSMKSDILDDEAPLVTNATREQFVKDYIFWLTDKSIRPQFDAFAKGFYTCLDRTALSMFTAEALKLVVEGHQEIDIEGLEKTTTYEDYKADSPTVVAFWEVVKSFTPEQRGQLLEFVTATDRVPVNGIGSVVFRIQKNGYDDVRLPTSATCFGTLLLPDYSTKEILEEKLLKAIVNTKGFGVG